MHFLVGCLPWKPATSAVSLPLSSGGKRMDQQVRDQAPVSEDYLLKNLGYGYSHIEMPRNKQTRDSPSFLKKMYDQHIPKCSFQKPVPIPTIAWILNPGRRGSGKAQQHPLQMFPERFFPRKNLPEGLCRDHGRWWRGSSPRRQNQDAWRAN